MKLLKIANKPTKALEEYYFAVKESYRKKDNNFVPLVREFSKIKL